MLNEYYLASAEYRQRLNAFNKRAARGEFIRHELPASERRVALAARLGELALVIRSQWSRNWVQGLLTRTGWSG